MNVPGWTAGQSGIYELSVHREPFHSLLLDDCRCGVEKIPVHGAWLLSYAVFFPGS